MTDGIEGAREADAREELCRGDAMTLLAASFRAIGVALSDYRQQVLGNDDARGADPLESRHVFRGRVFVGLGRLGRGQSEDVFLVKLGAASY